MSGGKSFCGSGLSARAGRRAFTLIELLVVISVVVLLMALLFPALSRARKQARAVVCQANLKQWGTLLALYVNENDGRLPQAPDRADGDYAFQGWGGFGAWSGSWYPDTYGDTGDLHFCPMATQVASPSESETGSGTFSALRSFSAR